MPSKHYIAMLNRKFKVPHSSTRKFNMPQTNARKPNKHAKLFKKIDLLHKLTEVKRQSCMFYYRRRNNFKYTF